MEISMSLKKALSKMGTYQDVPFSIFFITSEDSKQLPTFSESVLRAEFIQERSYIMYKLGLKVSVSNMMIYQSLFKYLLEPSIPDEGRMRIEVVYTDHGELKMSNTGFFNYLTVKANNDRYLTHLGDSEKTLAPLVFPGDDGLGNIMKFIERTSFCV